MKRLVFCFDGSWNQIDAPHPTNVLFTAQSVLPMAPDGTAQLIYYDEGVGTEKGEKLRGGMFGKGLEKNLNDAYRFLIFNHTPGDEIYVFGFSRGAFTARSFAGLISNCGILGRRHAGKVNETLQLYRTRENTDASRLKLMNFRYQFSPEVCVSKAEDEWRVAKGDGYKAGQSPLWRIKYVGGWDTVGSLGIPAYLVGAEASNREYQFHDLKLSPFVESARHAVAIDERKLDFRPTLWENLDVLNAASLSKPDALDAPYQQKWFPGNHGSVGGGGDRRGLSDQALDWIWDGARHAGLRLDTSPQSRIYELAPSDLTPLDNTTDTFDFFDIIGFVIDQLPVGDREPGPQQLHEVSVGARRRWHRKPEELPERVAYRPKTLEPVSGPLGKLDPGELGLGSPPNGSGFTIHEVAQHETLSAIAVLYYHDAGEWPRIFEANKYKIDDPDKIYVGQVLRIPML